MVTFCLFVNYYNFKPLKNNVRKHIYMAKGCFTPLHCFATKQITMKMIARLANLSSENLRSSDNVSEKCFSRYSVKKYCRYVDLFNENNQYCRCPPNPSTSWRLVKMFING